MAVEGSIQTRTYQDKEGKNRKVVEILANNVYFTESRSSSQSAAPSIESHVSENDNSPGNMPELDFSAGENDDFAVIAGDDDLPF